MPATGIPNPYGRQGEDQPFGYTGYRHDGIGGTYFAQAREYQPQNGRFTAEDVIKGNGAFPETLNRYGYCWGNPVGLVDLDGREPEKSTSDLDTDWFSEFNFSNYFQNNRNSQQDILPKINYNDYLQMNDSIETIPNEEKTSTMTELFFYYFEDTIVNGGQGDKDTMDKINTAVQITRIIGKSYDGTNTVGINGSGTLGIWQHDVSVGASIDAKGNVGIQGTYSCGISTAATPSWALLGYRTTSNAPDIYALEGDGVNIGGSVSAPVNTIPLVVGADFNLIGDVNSKPYNGYFGDTFSVGIGSGNEGHVQYGGTVTLFSFNVFDWWNDIYNKHKKNECEVME